MESFTIQVKRENVTENSFEDADISSSAYDVNNENENSHEIDIKEENVLLQRDGMSYYGDFPGKNGGFQIFKGKCCYVLVLVPVA